MENFYHSIKSLHFNIQSLSIDEQNFEIPKDYNEVFRHKDFYLEVGKLNRICIASFDYLEYRLENIKENITDKENIIPSGPEEILEKYYPARGFDIEQGIYEFDLIGLERKVKLERQSKNYAYAFVFRKNNNAKNDNYEKADNDKYKFDIISYGK